MKRENENIRIRTAKIEDARELLEIYAPYVENTAITFEYDVPSPEEFQQRIRRTLKKYPFLVAEQEGEPAGYVYAGPLNVRHITGQWKRPSISDKIKGEKESERSYMKPWKQF